MRQERRLTEDGMRTKALTISILLGSIVPLVIGCAAASHPIPQTQRATPKALYWQPTGQLSWQWQLSGTVDISSPAHVYDIDGFMSTADLVTQLHARGQHVVCYVSVGSWEDWRPDAGQFPAGIIGKDYTGWPGEKWLDIRRLDVLGPLLEHRLDMCKAKGFDALEPDNIDGYANETGFPLTYADQLTFNRWLAEQAHQRGLSIGLKNDAEQVPDLVSSFDWALTEDCFSQGWCAKVAPFIHAGKSVFAAEYTDTGITLSKFCKEAQTLGFSAILKNRDLDAWVASC